MIPGELYVLNQSERLYHGDPYKGSIPMKFDPSFGVKTSVTFDLLPGGVVITVLSKPVLRIKGTHVDGDVFIIKVLAGCRVGLIEMLRYELFGDERCITFIA